VRCLARSGSSRAALAGVDVEWVSGDVCELESLRAAIEGCQAVFHVAALYALWARDSSEFQRTNVEGTRNVLTAAKELGVRVVHTSSVACVGQAPVGGAANEDRSAVPGDLCGGYERSKYEGERLALAAAAEGQEVVVVNPSSTLGPGDLKPTPTGKIIVDFLEGRLPYTLDTGLNFVDVRDVARGHVLAFEKGVSGQRYILGNAKGNLSLQEFLRIVAEVAGTKSPGGRIPYAVAWLAGALSTVVARFTGRPPRVPLVGVQIARHRMVYDPSRAINELGMPQTPLRETVKAAVDSHRHGVVERPVVD
jgi:dihydroflavonol-4-reductase